MLGNALIGFIALGVLINNFIIEYQMEMQAKKRSGSLAEIVLVSSIGTLSTMSGMLLATAFKNPFWLFALILILSILIQTIFRLLIFRFNRN